MQIFVGYDEDLAHPSGSGQIQIQSFERREAFSAIGIITTRMSSRWSMFTSQA
jgi:hypothetical protein